MEFVQVRGDGPVAVVTINRPERHNAFNEAVIAELHEVFTGLQSDEDHQAVVLRAEGRSFCAGADLDWLRRASGWSEAENREDALRLSRMLRAIAECPLPVVARVHAGAFGGGVGVVAAADLAIAAESAEFAFSEARLGLIPATIAPHVVEKIGPGWARRLFLTAERFPASLAYQIGLLYTCVPDEQLDAVLESTLQVLLSGGRLAKRSSKELVRLVTGADPRTVDDETATLLARVRVSAEGQEGIRAFLEKRRPSWLPQPRQ